MKSRKSSIEESNSYSSLIIQYLQNDSSCFIIRPSSIQSISCLNLIAGLVSVFSTSWICSSLSSTPFETSNVGSGFIALPVHTTNNRPLSGISSKSIDGKRFSTSSIARITTLRLISSSTISFMTSIISVSSFLPLSDFLTSLKAIERICV